MLKLTLFCVSIAQVSVSYSAIKKTNKSSSKKSSKKNKLTQTASKINSTPKNISTKTGPTKTIPAKTIPVKITPSQLAKPSQPTKLSQETKEPILAVDKTLEIVNAEPIPEEKIEPVELPKNISDAQNSYADLTKDFDDIQKISWLDLELDNTVTDKKSLNPISIHEKKLINLIKKTSETLNVMAQYGKTVTDINTSTSLEKIMENTSFLLDQFIIILTDVQGIKVILTNRQRYQNIEHELESQKIEWETIKKTNTLEATTQFITQLELIEKNNTQQKDLIAADIQSEKITTDIQNIITEMNAKYTDSEDIQYISQDILSQGLKAVFPRKDYDNDIRAILADTEKKITEFQLLHNEAQALKLTQELSNTIDDTQKSANTMATTQQEILQHYMDDQTDDYFEKFLEETAQEFNQDYELSDQPIIDRDSTTHDIKKITIRSAKKGTVVVTIDRDENGNVNDIIVTYNQPRPMPTDPIELKITRQWVDIIQDAATIDTFDKDILEGRAHKKALSAVINKLMTPDDTKKPEAISPIEQLAQQFITIVDTAKKIESARSQLTDIQKKSPSSEYIKQKFEVITDLHTKISDITTQARATLITIISFISDYVMQLSDALIGLSDLQENISTIFEQLNNQENYDDQEIDTNIADLADTIQIITTYSGLLNTITSSLQDIPEIGDTLYTRQSQEILKKSTEKYTAVSTAMAHMGRSIDKDLKKYLQTQTSLLDTYIKNPSSDITHIITSERLTFFTSIITGLNTTLTSLAQDKKPADASLINDFKKSTAMLAGLTGQAGKLISSQIDMLKSAQDRMSSFADAAKNLQTTAQNDTPAWVAIYEYQTQKPFELEKNKYTDIGLDINIDKKIVDNTTFPWATKNIETAKNILTDSDRTYNTMQKTDAIFNNLKSMLPQEQQNRYQKDLTSLKNALKLFHTTTATILCGATQTNMSLIPKYDWLQTTAVQSEANYTVDLENADLTGVNMQQFKFPRNTNINKTIFKRTDLRGATLINTPGDAIWGSTRKKTAVTLTDTVYSPNSDTPKICSGMCPAYQKEYCRCPRDEKDEDKTND